MPTKECEPEDEEGGEGPGEEGRRCGGACRGDGPGERQPGERSPEGGPHGGKHAPQKRRHGEGLPLRSGGEQRNAQRGEGGARHEGEAPSSPGLWNGPFSEN